MIVLFFIDYCKFEDAEKINAVWSFKELMGYLETWPATQHYIKKNNRNPLELIQEELKGSWQKSDKKATFPLLLRIGKLK
ncbi:hypothetical protein QO200_08680 [Flavobacterium sp. Arc3]|jgi:hypothetical protein|uniref:hypothetical protein n=1 Tax=unclassified Flavobacterium TaxID=196869 RepID=UPI00352F78A5